MSLPQFWSSVDLTGNQTDFSKQWNEAVFWSSVDLTGNQTNFYIQLMLMMFWSSVDLTGNQTAEASLFDISSFGAVSI